MIERKVYSIMAISKERKQQILIESFDSFKDDWNTHYDTLTQAISKMSKIDFEVAIQMWEYLLKNNSSSVKADASITSGIFIELSMDMYSKLINKSSLIENIFTNGCEVFRMSGIMGYLVKTFNYGVLDILFGYVQKNKNVAETIHHSAIFFSYGVIDDYETNLSRMLHDVINESSDLCEESVDFFSLWIDKVENKTERLKLSVLLLSRESDQLAMKF